MEHEEILAGAINQLRAIGITILALILTLALDSYLHLSNSPFLFFSGAIIISIWYGGTSSGFVSAVISGILANYYFMEPKYQLIGDTSASIRTLLFILQGFVISYLCGSLRNSQERAHSHLQKWRESEERYREITGQLEAVLQQMPAGVLLADAVTENLLMANRQVENILGYGYPLKMQLTEYDQIITFKGFSKEGKLMSPEDWPLARSLRTGEIVQNQEVEIRWPDGKHIFIDVNSAPIRNREGKILSAVAIFLDITERVQIESALRKNEQLARTRARELEIFMETVPVAVWIAHDRDCHHMTANRTAYELIRQSGGSTITATPADGVYPFSFKIKKNGVDLPLNELPMQRAARLAQSVEEEFEFFFGEDDIRYIYGKAVPIQDDKEEVRGVVGAFIDITERVKTQLRLEEQARELEALNLSLTKTTNLLGQRNIELDRFAYVISHDLKAPLRAIANLSVWLEEDLEGCLSGETKHSMELLRGRVYRLEALIDGLLAYSRIGRLEIKGQMVDVYELLTEVIDSLLIPEDFTVKIQQPQPVIYTKRLLLGQVFSNLISNAIKHHGGVRGKVEIGAIDRGDAIEFTVSDDGPGISPQFHDRIFAIFQTLKPKDKEENTGIGLSIVKKIIDTEGGKIWIDSCEGEGATFHFTWPEKSV